MRVEAKYGVCVVWSAKLLRQRAKEQEEKDSGVAQNNGQFLQPQITVKVCRRVFLCVAWCVVLLSYKTSLETTAKSLFVRSSRGAHISSKEMATGEAEITTPGTLVFGTPSDGKVNLAPESLKTSYYPRLFKDTRYK